MANLVCGCGTALAPDPWALADLSAYYCPACRTRTVVRAPPEPAPMPGGVVGASSPTPPEAGRPVTLGEVIAAAIDDPIGMPIRSMPGAEPPASEPGRLGRGRRLLTGRPQREPGEEVGTDDS